MDDSDIKYMQRALELAQLGLGHTRPNPLVGCVIVHENQIIGEGYHQKYGYAHAEVNAINSVSDQSLLANSTAYVTLEPCSHHGKTPPCSTLLIEKGIQKVVVASKDPFFKVNGKGIEMLKAAGTKVEFGVLEKEVNEQNRRFLIFHKKKRPYVILKWAQTSDAFIAKSNFDSKWISNELSRQLVHKWRTEEAAIMVGKNTALYDNPLLTARVWNGQNPIRILLDHNLEVDEKANLFNEDAQTLIFNSKKEAAKNGNRWIKLDKMSPQAILTRLYEFEIQSVIIEGGAEVLNSFIKENCWDEARIFTSQQTFGAGIKAPKIYGELINEESIFNDRLSTYRNEHG